MFRQSVRNYLPVYLVMGLEPVNRRSPLDIALQAIHGGITMLQMREKNKPLKDVIREGTQLRQLCRQHHIPFIVNDRLDVALLLDADGVHVGQDDLPYSSARQLLGDDLIIGVSAGNLEEAEQAVQDGADYLGVGAVYSTRTKGDAGEPIGTELITLIKNKWNIPQVGIGGITSENASAVIKAGADGIAVVSAVTHHSNPMSAAKLLKQSVYTAR